MLRQALPPAPYTRGLQRMTADEVRELLRSKCDQAGSARTWAAKNEVSPAYVSDVLSGRREPGETILVALGIERIVTYRRKR